MKSDRDDTIVAIATPLGNGALSIVRISGIRAIEIADKVFCGKEKLQSVSGFTIHRGFVLGTEGQKMDEVLASVFRSPQSYTGEDSVEFSCHGGVLVPQSVLEALLDAGARQAHPGEFTKRAFLNKRIDLSQAEAVAELIAARSRRAQEASLAQLEGKLGSHVEKIRKALLELCSLLERDLDFSEEGIEGVSDGEVLLQLTSTKKLLDNLASSYEQGKILREGISVAIVGRPNVGKSSLFNALLEEGRAIVTHIPGTTRDSLEENLILSGILAKIVDTAGLRESSDLVETEGIRRTRTAIQGSGVLILVLDAAQGEAYESLFEEIRPIYSGQKIVVAHNKVDLIPPRDWSAKRFNFHEFSGVEMGVSAREGSGIPELRKQMATLVQGEEYSPEISMFMINQRHWEALSRASKSLDAAIGTAKVGMAKEFVAFDAREAAGVLAEITGEITSEELLNHIFSRFCIGK